MSEKSLELLKVARSNLGFVEKFDKQSESSIVSYKLLIEIVSKSNPIFKKIDAFAPQYDFDETSPGNGYRSFVYVYEKAVERTLNLCEIIQEKRSGFFYRKCYYEKYKFYFCKPRLLPKNFSESCQLMQVFWKTSES